MIDHESREQLVLRLRRLASARLPTERVDDARVLELSINSGPPYRHLSDDELRRLAQEHPPKTSDERAALVAELQRRVVGAQEPQPVRYTALDLHVQIETERAAFQVGDPIRIKLTLKNVASHPVKFMNDSPRGHVRLRVTDDSGRAISPNPMLITQRFSGSSRLRTLKAGRASTLRWPDEWLNLQDWWGYQLTPGRYTIVGIPRVWGPRLTPADAVRSNEVTISISP